MKKLLFYLLLILLVNNFSYSGSINLTVDDAVNRALKNNLSFKNSQLELDSKFIDAASSWNTLLPSARVNLSGNTEKTGSVNMGLSASLQINPSKIVTIGQSINEYKKGLITYESARKKLTKEVKEYYYYILLIDGKLSLQKNKVLILKEREKAALIKYKSGAISEIEKISHDVELRTGEYELRKLTTQYNQAVKRFKNSINISDDSDIVLSDKLPDILFTDIEYSEKIIENNTDVLLAYSNLSSSRFNSILAVTDILPSFSMEYSHSGNYSDSFSINQSGTLGFGISMSLQSLIPFSSAQTAVIKNSQKTAMDKNTVENIKSAIRTDLSNVVTSIEELAEDYENLKLNEELYFSKYQLSEKSYNSGTGSYLELKEAESGVFEAQLKILEAKYDFAVLLLEYNYLTESDGKN